MKLSRALPCDLCDEPAVVQIITVVFDGPSPADQLLCPVHAPDRETNKSHVVAGPWASGGPHPASPDLVTGA